MQNTTISSNYCRHLVQLQSQFTPIKSIYKEHYYHEKFHDLNGHHFSFSYFVEYSFPPKWRKQILLQHILNMT